MIKREWKKHYKTVGLTKETVAKLTRIQKHLGRRFGFKLTLSDVIGYLVKHLPAKDL